MEKKFDRDIKMIKDSRVLNLDDNKDYTEPFNKDDRTFINLYFIERQLKAIKWALFGIVIILLIILIK